MKRVGNLASNQIYNPQNIRPPVHYEPDATDSAMERYIRQKYQESKVQTSQMSKIDKIKLSDKPPPLPPKTGITFGLRTTSSTFPLESMKSKETAQLIDHENSPMNSAEINKSSGVFGIVFGGQNNDYSKHRKLCPNGSADWKTNQTMLNVSECNFEHPIANPFISTKDKAGRPKNGENRSFSYSDIQVGPINSKVQASNDTTISKISTNPFDLESKLSSTHPQSSQSTGGLPITMKGNLDKQAPSTSPPVSMPFQSPYNLDQSFQNMSLDVPQQLFPNRTGPEFLGAQIPHIEINQHTITPPMPSMPREYCSQLKFQSSTQSLPLSPNSNPFTHLSQPSHAENGNKFCLSNHLTIQTSPSSADQYSSVNQNIATSHDNLAHDSHKLSNFCLSGINPFASPQYSHLNEPIEYHNTYTQNPQENLVYNQTNVFMPQKTSRINKETILELYKHPQMAPKPCISEQQSNPDSIIMQQSQAKIAEPNSVANNTNNPFACDASDCGLDVNDVAANSHTVSRIVTRESLSFDTAGWMNGRHSPDAWKSISARSMR